VRPAVNGQAASPGRRHVEAGATPQSSLSRRPATGSGGCPEPPRSGRRPVASRRAGPACGEGA